MCDFQICVSGFFCRGDWTIAVKYTKRFAINISVCICVRVLEFRLQNHNGSKEHHVEILAISGWLFDFYQYPVENYLRVSIHPVCGIWYSIRGCIVHSKPGVEWYGLSNGWKVWNLISYCDCKHCQSLSLSLYQNAFSSHTSKHKHNTYSQSHFTRIESIFAYSYSLSQQQHMTQHSTAQYAISFHLTFFGYCNSIHWQ